MIFLILLYIDSVNIYSSINFMELSEKLFNNEVSY